MGVLELPRESLDGLITIGKAMLIPQILPDPLSRQTLLQFGLRFNVSVNVRR